MATPANFRWFREAKIEFFKRSKDKEADMSNAQMIIELDRKRMTAMAQKDVAALKNMICKDLVYTHSSGRQDTKQSLLDGMESGTTV